MIRFGIREVFLVIGGCFVGAGVANEMLERKHKREIFEMKERSGLPLFF